MLQSKTYKIVLAIFVSLVISVFIFQAGIFVGYHKAAFSYHLGERYYETFGKPHTRSFFGMKREDFSGAHGVTGTIIKIDLPTIIIEEAGHIPKSIHTGAGATIKHRRITV